MKLKRYAEFKETSEAPLNEALVGDFGRLHQFIQEDLKGYFKWIDRIDFDSSSWVLVYLNTDAVGMDLVKRLGARVGIAGCINTIRAKGGKIILEFWP